MLQNHGSKVNLHRVESCTRYRITIVPITRPVGTTADCNLANLTLHLPHSFYPANYRGSAGRLASGRRVKDGRACLATGAISVYHGSRSWRF